MSAYVVDRSLPFASQSTCVRLSLNLVECLYQSFKRSDADMAAKSQAQQLLSKILDSFVSKLHGLKEDIPRLMEAAKAEKLDKDTRLKTMWDQDLRDDQVMYLQVGCCSSMDGS